MKNKLALKTLALACCFATATAWAKTDTLQDVVKEALEYNPEVQAKFNAFDASTHERREAFGGYLPSIDLEGSLGSAERQYDDGRGWYTRNYAEARLTQMLFDGFLVRNRVNYFEHSSRERY